MRWLTFAVLLTSLTSAAAPLHAQRLRDRIAELFIFGSGQDPLFLGGSGNPNNPQNIQAHGPHFVPSAVGENARIISFLTNAVAGSVGNIPVSATSSGPLFRFEGGVPVRTPLSPGPIFGERAETLGKGRVFVGSNLSRLHFTTLRGADLENLRLTFTHSNVDFPGCDDTFEGDCTRMGVPGFENDVIDLTLRLGLDVSVASFFVTYGLFERVDVGLVLPVVNTTLDGESIAQITPFGPNVSHFFAGTLEAPVLSASRAVRGSATGVGDVAVRAKVNVRSDERSGLALLGDVRFPTGSEEDLLGAGELSVRGLAVFSARRGEFTPHANLGYLYREGDVLTDAVLATVGFDHLLTSWATLAVDLVSELQAGSRRDRNPETVVIEAPFQRTVEPLTIPDRRDDIVFASLGFKFTTGAGLTAVANGAWPLNRGGLRPGVIGTLGLEYTF
ncbi:MAG: hypothetical protein K0S86_147 [Geminicoccaceae bacterium]|jgi:hypothetical protein|nr:hypothetical protein [Geminicoccaceae bacterium]